MKLFLALLLSVFLFGNTTSFASNKMPAKTKAVLHQAKEYAKNPDKVLSANSLQFPYTIENNVIYVELLLKINNQKAVEEVKALGCEILVQTKSILAVKAPVNVIAKLEANNNIIAIEASQRRSIRMDESKKVINAETVTNTKTETVIGGEGVIVGVFDTGIDIAHPDFSDENGTRILKLWDISDKTTDKTPQGFNFGREYTKADIDNDPESVLQFDVDGHGTHVAGTAAGGGKGNPNLRGIAYNSDLIIVKGIRDDEKDLFTDADIIAGCQYIFAEAKKLERPAVINLSLGSVIGPHDGKSLLSLALSSLTDEGYIIVAAAGNDGNNPIHAGGKVSAEEVVEFPIYPINICDIFEHFCPDIPNFFMTAADVWYTADIIESFGIVLYTMGMQGPEIYAAFEFEIDDMFENEMLFDDAGRPLGFLTLAGNPNVPTNGDGNIMIQIHNGGMEQIDIEQFLWSIVFETKGTGTIDMWAGLPLPDGFPFQSLVGEKFFTGDNKMTFGSPGDGDSIVCVGSFVTKNSWTDMNGIEQQRDWEVGRISSFSSLGPDRYGRMLPLISAPGQIIFSSRSKDSYVPDAYLIEGEEYVGYNGTSMASPHVAGAIALMLQVNPKLRFSDIYHILDMTAKRDEFTGPEPNNTYGYGKIDVQAAINYIVSQSSVPYIRANDVKVYPNPAINHINLELDGFADNASIYIYSYTGQIVATINNANIQQGANGSIIVLEIDSLPAGIYNADCIYGNKIAKFKFVVSGK